MNPISVHVVIPSRDNLAELRDCLASLVSQTRPPERIVVCVDGSMDGTLEYLERVDGTIGLPVQVRTHPGYAHLGRSATRNLALGVLGDGFTWFVDSDMVLDQDALSRHLEVVEAARCTSVGAVTYANASEAPWAGYLATRGRHRWPDGATLPFTQFTTANALVPSALVRALGGFDERFVRYGGEDIDFAYRLQQLTGQPFVNNRRAIARTIETKTPQQALAQLEEYSATNLHLLEAMHPDMPRTFNLQRLDSRRLKDRAFVTAVNPTLERLVDAALLVAPRALRNQLLNYKVVAAVWRGYRSPRATAVTPMTDS